MSDDATISRPQLIELVALGLIRCRECGRPATREFSYEYEHGDGTSVEDCACCPNPECAARLISRYEPHLERQAPYAAWLTAFVAGLTEEEIEQLDAHRVGSADFFSHQHWKRVP